MWQCQWRFVQARHAEVSNGWGISVMAARSTLTAGNCTFGGARVWNRCLKGRDCPDSSWCADGVDGVL